jgi:hypothetical protein
MYLLEAKWNMKMESYWDGVKLCIYVSTKFLWNIGERIQLLGFTLIPHTSVHVL